MTCPIGVFDAKSVIVQIRFNNVTHRVSGFGDGDYVTVEPAQERATIQTGADGFHIANFTANNGHNITLSLQAQSRSARYLRQRAELRDQFQLTIESPDTGESGFTNCAIITNTPGLRFGTEAGTREWSIFAGNWEDTSREFT